MKPAELKDMTRAWVAMLWAVMSITGKGYRFPGFGRRRERSTRTHGEGVDRRSDKLEYAKRGEPQWLRRLNVRHS